MKTKILIAAVMFCALSVTAFAQAPGSTFTVGSDTVTTVACCGVAERTGDITFTTVPATPNSVTGTMTIRYSVPIANTIVPDGIPVGAMGPVVSLFDGTNNLIDTFSPLQATNQAGRGIVIFEVPGGLVPPYSLTLSGIRVNVSAAALCGSDEGVAATITSNGNQLTSGETVVTVVSDISQALLDPEIEDPARINRVAGEPANVNVNLLVGEAFFDAFGAIPADDLTQNIGFMVRLNVSAVPAGVTLTFPGADNSGLFTLVTSAGAPLGSQVVTSAVPGPVYYMLTTSSNAAELENLDVDITVTTAGPFPIADTPVTITAQPAPIGGTTIPRFDSACVSEPATVLTFFGSTTTLLIPYAANTIGYDTGISIANTTLDPGTVAMGVDQAVRQVGGMTFYFFPQDGEMFSYETDGDSPGGGLDGNGELTAGNSYIVLLSELLTAAEADLDFAGYVFVITNFTNAHGQYFISDFDTFSNGALMLVVKEDRDETPEGLEQ